jgi:hypothetical protein
MKTTPQAAEPSPDARRAVPTHEEPPPPRRLRLGYWRRLAREPFLHFALLGACVFALHRMVAPPDTARPAITVDSAKRAELCASFAQREGRKPTDRETRELVRSHVEQELLFQEGLVLELVQHDPVVRDLLIAQTRALIEASFEPRTPSEAELRGYYAAHASEYLVPRAVRFVEYALGSGSDAEETARSMLQALNAGLHVEATPVAHPLRSESEIAAAYGAEFSRQVTALSPAEWHVLLSEHRVYLIKVEERTPPRKLPFSALGRRLPGDFQMAERRRAFEREIARIRERFLVKIEGDAP